MWQTLTGSDSLTVAGKCTCIAVATILADQVGVIFDNERQFGDLQTCPSSDDFEPTCDDWFDKFELVRLLSVQRPLVASWKELADKLYEKGANQVVAFVVRKDRVGIG